MVFPVYGDKVHFDLPMAEPFTYLHDPSNVGDGYFVTQVQTKQDYQPFGKPVGLYGQGFSGQDNHHAAIGAGGPSPEILQ